MSRQLKSGEYLGHVTAVGRWDSCSVSETHYGRGAFLPAHRHDGGFLTFILAGSYRERTSGETRSCTPRSLVIHEPGETHEDDLRNVRQQISLASVAREVGVHPVHLARQFRKHYGVSVGERVRFLRVERAKELIAAGMSLPGVALEMGFADQSHFTRTFMKLAGMSPGMYRRKSQHASRIQKR
ncbi:MAG TPA: helix-turn-helix transcriptional regulator [Thermoanaerobaculia bacterium]|nr:helix-turn-helix transcriptional regulator [Thermoanaerobaculia bacterium]